MTSTTSILISALPSSAVGLLWYLFRPDTLVVNKRVDEPFPRARAVVDGKVARQKGARSTAECFTVMRAPHGRRLALPKCDSAMLRIVRTRTFFCVDVAGIRLLTIPENNTLA